MDKEEARFVLRCFRPDGADAENPDFAEALACAAKDRELGEWLARERAEDAAFSVALAAVAIPPNLREEILAGLAYERGGDPLQPDAFDSAVIGALAALQPAGSLRDEVLAAMARTVAARRPWWQTWRLSLPLAAAAGIALAIPLSRSHSPVEDPVAQQVAEVNRQAILPVATPLTIGTVEAGSIKTLESPTFTLDLNNPDHHALFEHLKSAKLPCPNGCLPKGLKDIPGMGCRELEIDGKRGAMVCFKQEEDVVHLVIFRRNDVSCRLPQRDHPDLGEHGRWAVARWEDRDWVFVLMGDGAKGIDPKRLGDLF